RPHAKRELSLGVRPAEPDPTVAAERDRPFDRRSVLELHDAEEHDLRTQADDYGGGAPQVGRDEALEVVVDADAGSTRTTARSNGTSENETRPLASVVDRTWSRAGQSAHSTTIPAFAAGK